MGDRRARAWRPVAATARDTGAGRPRRPVRRPVLPLARRHRPRRGGAAVAAAHERFGRLDVVVNNAGYGQFGMIEEISEAGGEGADRDDVFGALWVTQAALPVMRAQGSGHILQVSSIGGVNAFPNIGIYHASKWALEAFSQSLAQEVAGFGIKVTLIEPGVRHRLGRPVGGARPAAARLPGARAGRAGAQQRGGAQGDPAATGDGDAEVVDAERRRCGCSSATSPLGMPAGSTSRGSRSGRSGNRCRSRRRARRTDGALVTDVKGAPLLPDHDRTTMVRLSAGCTSRRSRALHGAGRGRHARPRCAYGRPPRRPPVPPPRRGRCRRAGGPGRRRRGRTPRGRPARRRPGRAVMTSGTAGPRRAARSPVSPCGPTPARRPGRVRRRC